MKRSRILFVFVGFALLWFGAELLCDWVDGNYNGVINPGPYAVSSSSAALHHKSLVADLHADPLLWCRKVHRRARQGQVDLPRLVEGGVGLQVFGVVTKSPKGQNFERNTGDSDRLTALFMARRSPPKVWFSLYERALYQARRLEDSVAGSKGQMVMVRTEADLERLVDRKAAGEKVVGALLGLEGAHALEDEFENLQGLFDAGFRMIGLTHFFDNEVAGSAHGVEQGGLTDLGRRVVVEAEKLGMAIDLAHSSTATLHEVIALATRPVVVSHTGVRATCEGPRNLSDADLRAVASTGGIVGIGFFRGATCGDDLAAILNAIEHAVQVVGVDHVSLGSDFDGAVTTPMDASGMPLITEGLLERGFSQEEIQKILGGNVVRFLGETLP